MTIRIGNAPCSWGVEFADDPRNPPWRKVLAECAEAGFAGIELGPIGFMPEEPAVLADALLEHGLTLIGGVVFRPFHDPLKWEEVKEAAVRTCEALVAHGARQLVLIDSISARRAKTAGRPQEAEQLDPAAWKGFVERFATIADMGSRQYGLEVSVHPHAGGFMDFLPEVEALLLQTDPSTLKLCVDTGHSAYAGFDPLDVMDRYFDRLAYVHFKSTNAKIRSEVIAQRADFYDACARGLFCTLADGEIDFRAVRKFLQERGYQGWCTVEQDCDPAGQTSPLLDAKQNGEYLRSIGFE